MEDEHEHLLWRRVAALHGIEVPKRTEARILGDRFQIRISRQRRRTREIERAVRLAGQPTCQGVVGEILPGGGPRRPDPLGWRRALIEREAERLALTQPDRRGL